MKLQELRIGNYVRFSFETSKTAIVKGLVDGKVHYEKEDGKLNVIIAPYIEPIPLTNEWLLKLGFVKHEQGYSIESGRQGFIMDLAQDTDWIILYRDDIGCRYNSLIFLDYVHQLQNLYFALTGEELKLK